MSAYPKRLLSIQDLKVNQAQEILELAKTYKASSANAIPNARFASKVVALAFLESSTRTRVSFEIACHRIGAKPIHFSGGSESSIAKGESAHETIETVLAMRPDALVTRYGGDSQTERVLKNANLPIVNGGDGRNEHPTQALLDAFTINERLGSIEGQKVLFVGDVEHSRVARSNLHLLTMLGAKVASCSPNDFKPTAQEWKSCEHFENLRDGLKWASVCVGLRIQKERHEKNSRLNLEEYIKLYRIDHKKLLDLSSKGLIMHPGPFVPGEDLTDDVLSDPRCAIHEQVTNGVFIRMAVLTHILEAR